MGTFEVLDLFSGIGGWMLGGQSLGMSFTGVELDETATLTSISAGHLTLHMDVRDVAGTGRWNAMVGSPPCQPFSVSGVKDGYMLRRDIIALARGGDVAAIKAFSSYRGNAGLVLEPLRIMLEGDFEWVCLEQVPSVLPVWEAMVERAERLGYDSTCGVVSAEMLGLPQVRRRAVFVATRRGMARLPAPTHNAYIPDLDRFQYVGPLLPWVSMADVTGWDDYDLIGFPRAADEGASIVLDGRPIRSRDVRFAQLPSATVTEKIRSWRRWPIDSGALWTRSIQITTPEAAVLQGFPADYPVHGWKTMRCQQIANAIPPVLARAILETVV